MKYKYKLAVIMGGIATFTMIIVVFFYAYFNKQINERELHNKIKSNIQMVSQQISDDADDLILLTKSIAVSDILQVGLVESNSKFATMTKIERETLIEDFNTRWQSTTDINDSFVQKRMTNDIAQYLKAQQNQAPDLFGEIFVTNKYGLSIATTNKLTAISQSDRPWFQNSFSTNEALVSLDDRGFDESVGAFALGIAVPIYDKNNSVIGFLKINYKISDVLTSELGFISQVNADGEYLVARRDGTIISKKDTEPLSQTPNVFIRDVLNNGQTVVGTYKDYMYGVVSIRLANIHNEIIFEGDDTSTYYNGEVNKNLWFVVYTVPTKISQRASAETLSTLIVVCIFLILGIIVISLVLGSYIAKPIKVLRRQMKRVGEGDLSVRISKISKDEIGELSADFNQMITNLDDITIKSCKLETQIDEQEKIQNKLRALNQRDVLTKLYNRRAFDEFYKAYSEKAKANSTSLAVIMFDIDDFKKINDTYGHLIGDQVLILMAEQISDTLRDPDIFARWGGEEFILLLPNTDSKVAYTVSERLRKTIAQTKFPTNERITISLGVAVVCSVCSKSDVMAKVDEAMYTAKKNGKNQTVLAEISKK